MAIIRPLPEATDWRNNLHLDPVYKDNHTKSDYVRNIGFLSALPPECVDDLFTPPYAERVGLVRFAPQEPIPNKWEAGSSAAQVSACYPPDDSGSSRRRAAGCHPTALPPLYHHPQIVCSNAQANGKPTLIARWNPVTFKVGACLHCGPKAQSCIPKSQRLPGADMTVWTLEELKYMNAVWFRYHQLGGKDAQPRQQLIDRIECLEQELGTAASVSSGLSESEDDRSIQAQTLSFNPTSLLGGRPVPGNDAQARASKHVRSRSSSSNASKRARLETHAPDVCGSLHDVHLTDLSAQDQEELAIVLRGDVDGSSAEGEPISPSSRTVPSAVELLDAFELFWTTSVQQVDARHAEARVIASAAAKFAERQAADLSELNHGYQGLLKTACAVLQSTTEKEVLIQTLLDEASSQAASMKVYETEMTSMEEEVKQEKENRISLAEQLKKAQEAQATADSRRRAVRDELRKRNRDLEYSGARVRELEVEIAALKKENSKQQAIINTVRARFGIGSDRSIAPSPSPGTLVTAVPSSTATRVAAGISTPTPLRVNKPGFQGEPLPLQVAGSSPSNVQAVVGSDSSVSAASPRLSRESVNAFTPSPLSEYDPSTLTPLTSGLNLDGTAHVSHHHQLHRSPDRNPGRVGRPPHGQTPSAVAQVGHVAGGGHHESPTRNVSPGGAVHSGQTSQPQLTQDTTVPSPGTVLPSHDVHAPAQSNIGQPHSTMSDPSPSPAFSEPSVTADGSTMPLAGDPGASFGPSLTTSLSPGRSRRMETRRWLTHLPQSDTEYGPDSLFSSPGESTDESFHLPKADDIPKAQDVPDHGGLAQSATQCSGSP